MKVSVSLADEDVAFLDEYAISHQVASRSAAVQQAVDLLRSQNLAEAYADAWDEWSASGEAALWESVVGDGLDDR